MLVLFLGKYLRKRYYMKTLKITVKPILVSLCIFSLLFSTRLLAQELSFAKGFGGASSETVTDIDIDSDGNIYLMGIFRGTVDFDPGEGVTELSTSDRRAIYVAKFNPSGDLIWAKQIGAGKADFGVSSPILNGKLEVDNTGNVYLYGHFAYRADFDPGPGTTTLTPIGTSQGPSDIFFSKWDTNGNLVWVKQIGGTSATDDLANDIALAPNGNIFITGAFRGTVDFNPGAGTNNLSASSATTGYVAEYTSSGEYVWAGGLFRAQTADPVREGSTIVISSSGSIFVGGYIQTGQFSSIGYISNISSTYNLLRYWEYESTGVTNPSSYINGLTLDSENNLYGTGSFNGTLDDLVSSGNHDVLVLNILSNGAQIWKKQVGGENYDQGLGISVGQSGEIYIIGEMGGTGDFDPGPEELLLTGTSFITAIDDNGDLYRSAKAIDVSKSGGVPGGFNALSALNGKIYLGGTYQGGDDLDPSSETLTLPFQGQSDAFLSVFTPEPITITIDENTPNGTVIATDVAGTAIVSGNTEGAFELVNSRIRVANQDAIDFETNPSFRLVISFPDGDRSYVINLNDVDESPVIESQEFTITSTIVDGGEVGTIIATDPNGDDLTFSVTSGDADNIFVLNENSGILSISNRELLDFSEPSTIALDVVVSDGTETSSATISVILNVAPGFNWSETDFAFDEGGPWTLSIPVTDPDMDELQVSIVSGNENALLSINNPTDDSFELVPTDQQNGIDFETESDSFELVLKVVDAFGNESTSNSISITINNINDNTPTLADQQVTIGEGTPNGTTVISLSGEDADGDELSYSLASGNTDDAFAIDANSGEVTVNNSAPLLFETNPTFSLVVNVSDGQFNTNATLTINLSQSTVPVIEDQSFIIISTITNGDEIGQIDAFDAQGDALTYTITEGNENEIFSLDSSSGILTLIDKNALDFSTPNTVEMTITVSDGEEEDSALISVILNVAPTFSWATTTFDFDENEAWTLEVPVSDAESDALTLTISPGDSENLFEIISTEINGAVTFELAPLTPFDFEAGPSSFTLTIEATDAFDNTTTSEPIAIIINNLNDNAPTATDVDVNINQNLPNGIVVTTVEASDADGDEFSFAIVAGNTEDAFVIDAGLGEITVANSSALVFETNPIFELEVEVSDGELSSVALITINLNEQNVNTAPIIQDQLFTLAENSENGVEVAIIEALDQEGDALTFTIISGNTDNAFLLTSSTGELIVTNSGVLDFETTPSFELLVSVTDGEFTEVAKITINLTDVEDSNTPPTIEEQSFEIAENSVAGTLVGRILANDAEGDILTYSITSGNELGGFTLNATNGDLTVASSEVLDFETTSSFELITSVTDGEFVDVATIVIVLTDQEETPVLSVAESVSFGIYPNPVSAHFALQDAGEVLSISIVNISGKKIRSFDSHKDNRYSVVGIQAGVYFIELKTPEGTVVSKLIIE